MLTYDAKLSLPMPGKAYRNTEVLTSLIRKLDINTQWSDKLHAATIFLQGRAWKMGRSLNRYGSFGQARIFHPFGNSELTSVSVSEQYKPQPQHYTNRNRFLCTDHVSTPHRFLLPITILHPQIVQYHTLLVMDYSCLFYNLCRVPKHLVHSGTRVVISTENQRLCIVFNSETVCL